MELSAVAPSQWRNVGLVLFAIATGVLCALVVRPKSSVEPAKPESDHVSAAAAPQHSSGEIDAALRFYLERVRRDPEETRSLNALAQLYLRRVRETGNEDDLPLALNAAHASLAAVDVPQNVGGLTALAQAEFANHDFAAARAHAEDLVALHPQKSGPFMILGDACLELGDYPAAIEAFQKMVEGGESDPGIETRLARLAVLQGQTESAQQHLSTALALLRAMQTPPREAIAWCQWQAGEIAFAVGDYERAERSYQDALATKPDEFRALASLGRLCAARARLPLAIRCLEQAVRIAPAIESVATLGDLYQLAGRNEAAAACSDLVAQLAEHSSKIHGTPYNRALANFFANHDLKAEEAYALAAGEYASGRHDIYGADALAWTALKANRLDDARTAIKEALKLGTLDARLFYHAGMIARAAGDRPGAASYLQRALDLNPGFDPRQSPFARAALQELSK